jgi:hypothetical protein
LPLVGDAFDFVWKANQKNSQLLNRYKQSPAPTVRRSLLDNSLFILMLIASLALTVMLVGWIIGLLWSRIQGA